MKIFPTHETSKIADTRNSASGAAVKKGGGGKKKSAPVKPAISESEIREKVASQVETSNTAKSGILKKNSQKLGEGFMNGEIKPQLKPVPAAPAAPAAEKIEKVENVEKEETNLLLKPDVSLNNPKDPAVQEKLKTVLSTGAFNFNPKEREALDKILNAN